MNLVSIISLAIIFCYLAYLLTRVILDISGSKTKFFVLIEPAERSKYDYLFLTLITYLFLTAIWCFISYSNLVPPLYVPTPISTLIELGKLITSREFLLNLLASLFRITVGFGLASLIALLLGSLAGTFKKMGALILPVNSSFRYIPPTAFISLTIIWFGIGESGKIALIFIAIVFYILQMTSDVIGSIPKVYIEAAQMLGANRQEIFRMVILRYSLPDIIAVLRINLGAAWTFLIVSELVASQRGLGYLIATSQRFLQTPKLFALIIIVGILGYLSDSLLGYIIIRLKKWKV